MERATMNMRAPGAAVGLSTPGEPMRMVMSAENDLRVNIEEAHTILTNLENRLAPVLSPTGSGSALGKQMPVVPVSPLTEQIQQRNAEVCALIERIQELLSRLEI